MKYWTQKKNGRKIEETKTSWLIPLRNVFLTMWPKCQPPTIYSRKVTLPFFFIFNFSSSATFKITLFDYKVHQTQPIKREGESIGEISHLSSIDVTHHLRTIIMWRTETTKTSSPLRNRQTDQPSNPPTHSEWLSAWDLFLNQSSSRRFPNSSFPSPHPPPSLVKRFLRVQEETQTEEEPLLSDRPLLCTFFPSSDASWANWISLETEFVQVIGSD